MSTIGTGWMSLTRWGLLLHCAPDGGHRVQVPQDQVRAVLLRGAHRLHHLRPHQLQGVCVCVCLVDCLHRRLSRGVADTLRGRVRTRTLKGSIALRGSDAAVEVKHSQGPLPRVLFEETEGHIFWIQYRYVEVQLLEPFGLSARSSLHFIVCNAHATILTNNDREGDLSSSLGGAGASPTATGDRRDVPLLSLAGTRDRRRFSHTDASLSPPCLLTLSCLRCFLQRHPRTR
jgi:hypothetical protein